MWATAKPTGFEPSAELNASLAWSASEDDNQGQIRESYHASCAQLPQLLVFDPPIDQRGQTRSDENEVPDSAEQNHHSYKVPHQARLQKGPKRGRPSLHVMSHEEIETIPDDGGREARANAPHAVVPSKHDDGYVNEGLEEMKEPKLGNN